MDREIRKLLADVKICLENIDSYIGEKEIFEQYETNFLLQDAVERNLITIGEAVNLLLKIKPDIPISNTRRIVDLRNRLTHGYDAIEVVMVWNVIIKYLPVLKTEVDELLEK